MYNNEVKNHKTHWKKRFFLFFLTSIFRSDDGCILGMFYFFLTLVILLILNPNAI